MEIKGQQPGALAVMEQGRLMSCLLHFEFAVVFLTEKTEPVNFDQQVNVCLQARGTGFGEPRAYTAQCHDSLGSTENQ